MSELPCAIILSGGKGTRIQHLFPEIPKPLVLADGKPFLFWVTAWLNRYGIDDFIYSTGYQAELIHTWIAQEGARRPDLRLRYRREMHPLGTGGGLINCLDLCGKDIIVTNGDSLVDCDFAAGYAKYIRDDLDGLIFGLQANDASRFGTLEVDAQGSLVSFHEKRPGAGLINAGLYIFRTSILQEFESGVAYSVETDIIPKLTQLGYKLGVFASVDAAFIDIGTPETVIRATSFIKANRHLFDNSRPDNQ